MKPLKLLIIIVAVAGVAGYLIWQSHWKTYSNSQYGFEFKYPDHYSVRKERDNLLFIESKNGVLYAFILIDNPLGLTAPAYFEKFKQESAKQCETAPCASIVSSHAITINGLNGVDSTQAGEGSRDVRSVYFQTSDKIINYEYARDILHTAFGGDQALFDAYLSNGDKILSTIKLTH